MQVKFPIRITDKRGGSSSKMQLFWSEQPSDYRLDAHYREEIFGDMRNVDAIRLLANRNGSFYRIHLSYTLKRVRLGMQVFKIRVREPHVPPAGIYLPHLHDSIRLVVRERAQENAINNAEDGRTRSNSQRKGADRNSRA